MNRVRFPLFLDGVMDMVRWFSKSEQEARVGSAHERGATMIEYVLLLASVAVLGVTSVSYAGEETRDTFDRAQRAMATTSIERPDLPVLPD